MGGDQKITVRTALYFSWYVDVLLDRLEREFAATANPLPLFDAFHLCRDYGRVLPQWVSSGLATLDPSRIKGDLHARRRRFLARAEIAIRAFKIAKAERELHRKVKWGSVWEQVKKEIMDRTERKISTKTIARCYDELVPYLVKKNPGQKK